jgi:hypothetical protein
VSKKWEESVACPECGQATTTLMPQMKHHKAKDPFDMINGHAGIPDSKKIKSYANDRRKGGKDTT